MKPTPDDLRTVARNLLAEGHTSRAVMIDNAADLLEKYRTALQEINDTNIGAGNPQEGDICYECGKVHQTASRALRDE